MAMTTIKVSTSTRDRVKELGARTSQTAEDVVSRALEEYERALFWAEYAAAAEAVANDLDAEAEEARENALWESASLRDSAARG